MFRKIRISIERIKLKHWFMLQLTKILQQFDLIRKIIPPLCLL